MSKHINNIDILQDIIDKLVGVMTRLEQQCAYNPDIVYDNKEWIKEYLDNPYMYPKDVIKSIVTIFEWIADNA